MSRHAKDGSGAIDSDTWIQSQAYYEHSECTGNVGSSTVRGGSLRCGWDSGEFTKRGFHTISAETCGGEPREVFTENSET